MVLLLVITPLIAPTQAADKIDTTQDKSSNKLTLLSQDNIDHWQEKSFVGHTTYTFEHPSSNSTYSSNNGGNAIVLNATSKNSASGLVKRVRIDLKQTPWLHWRWKVTNTIQAPDNQPVDETSKSGDDYAARVYVIADGGLLFWKTRALNYVWASHQAQGSTWPNAYAGKNAVMLALRSGTDKTGSDKGDANQSNVWLTEKRNVYDDLQQAFGKDIRYIDAIAIMTDTDNTGAEASASYTDMYFSDH
ncbi:MAG: DUF3047 domain-containing protein [Porticoccaceae bacterium]